MRKLFESWVGDELFDVGSSKKRFQIRLKQDWAYRLSMCSNFTRFAGLTGAGFCRAQIVLDSSKLYCTYYPVLSYMLFHVFTQSSSSQSNKSNGLLCKSSQSSKSNKLLCIDIISNPAIPLEPDLKLFLLESISKSISPAQLSDKFLNFNSC